MGTRPKRCSANVPQDRRVQRPALLRQRRKPTPSRKASPPASSTSATERPAVFLPATSPDEARPITLASIDGTTTPLLEYAGRYGARLAVLVERVQVVAVVRKGKDWKEVRQKWEMRGVNKRMRFLKDEPGQFFKHKLGFFFLCVAVFGAESRLLSTAAHCDSHYTQEVDGKVFKTFFTLQLYLNNSVTAEAELVGGVMSFVSSDAKEIGVDPKAGRVLIFQHRGLYHAWHDVVKRTKYTIG